VHALQRRIRRCSISNSNPVLNEPQALQLFISLQVLILRASSFPRKRTVERWNLAFHSEAKTPLTCQKAIGVVYLQDRLAFRLFSSQA
jgi:hypothetical protein